MRLVAFAAAVSLGMTAANAAELPLLPMPSSIVPGKGRFVSAGAELAARGQGERAAANRLNALLGASGMQRLGFAKNGKIRFRRSAGIEGPEAYRLTVSSGGVDIEASSDAGLYYGAETLYQLMASSGPLPSIPSTVIDDHPAFSWRGVLLDSARHMQSISYIEELIDRMSAAKLNILHWHLSDDQGWRIEIDRYPRLTSIGAWRQEAGAAGIDPATGKPIRYGGFYTKKEVRELVRFAAAHHVTIVPEIDMPGHATAIIAAYPALASTSAPPVSPSNEWGVLPNLLNPSDDTFTFVENVLDEVMALFPGPFIHVGGDEAVKDQWKANPSVQAKIKALGLKDEDALQAWFTARVGTYLASRGRRLVGWDEILGGKVPANAVVMSWHGVDGAVIAAKSGHDAVLAASPILYLDHIQSPSADEPPGRGEIIGWRDLYEFDPLPPGIGPQERAHILGLQANLWTEHVRTLDYADRMLWPRAAIVAEVAWSNPKKNWLSFAPRLLAAMQRWKRLGEGFNSTPLEPLAAFGEGEGAVTAAISQPALIGTLRYTIDGSSPRAGSPQYREALKLSPGTLLSAQAFENGTPIGEAKRWVIGPGLARTRSASEMELCGNAIPLRLEDDGPPKGTRKVHWADIMHPCWIWRGAPLSRARRIVAEVGRLPFNFSIGEDIKKIVFRPPSTPAGELEVRRGGCEGPLIASIPVQPAAGTSGVAQVEGPITGQSSNADLCMTFTQKGPDPFWVLDRLTLQ
jgi:hexosaminidase